MLATGLVAIGVTPTSARPASSLRGDIVVSAAASLTESFTELAKRFGREYPNVRIRFNFASTTALVNQIQQGAPASVFASADLASHKRLAQPGNIVSSPRIFARNAMQIAVKPGNPLGIRSLSDLRRVDTLALCAKSVPCGVYAASVLARAGVTLDESSITRGVDAKATLGAVTFGDADAAIVYATDVRAAGKTVRTVSIPARHNVRALYGISLVRGASNRAAAQVFVNFVLSRDGQRVLKAYGFTAP
jgi:molybdate transport system substrate-binding protein